MRTRNRSSTSSQALLAATEGAAFGLFPIIWIVLTAIWIFRTTELTGYDLVLRRAFGSLSPDQRVQAIIIAFCFGALLEALAYVMNFSGQTVTLGLALAATGAVFAFLSPVVGWIGVAVTGSDTSANSLFGLLQTTAATQTGISPYLLGAANTSGGVLGKMISPQNLAIAAAVVGMEHKESALFRKVIWWSLGLLLGMCVLVYLQSTPVLGWMVVG